MKMIRRMGAAIFVLALALTGAAAADSNKVAAYGRHLAAECTGCHRPDAGAGAIPAIAGKAEAEIIAALKDFREGRKTNPVMVSVAKSLDDEQMTALAAYFASLPKPIATDGPVH